MDQKSRANHDNSKIQRWLHAWRGETQYLGHGHLAITYQLRMVHQFTIGPRKHLSSKPLISKQLWVITYSRNIVQRRAWFGLSDRTKYSRNHIVTYHSIFEIWSLCIQQVYMGTISIAFVIYFFYLWYKMSFIMTLSFLYIIVHS